MTLHHYILKDGKIITVPLLEWAQWIEERSNKIIEQTEVPGGTVSTVFLGLDHNFSNSGPPLLFETMVFMVEDQDSKYGTRECETDRYATIGDAKKGHWEFVAKYKAAQEKTNAE